MGGSGGEKKRKVEDSPASVGDRIEPVSSTPVLDTSKWPLLLKVSKPTALLGRERH